MAEDKHKDWESFLHSFRSSELHDAKKHAQSTEDSKRFGAR